MNREIDLVVIHCSATYPDMDIGAVEIKEWHLDRGWSDIGYHYVIRRDGSIEDGRPERLAGAHAKGANSNSIGICMVGGKARDGKQANNFTRAQWAALGMRLDQLKHRLFLSDKDIIGHNEISSKDCPCFDVRAWLA